MSERFQVVMTDFMRECLIEGPILEGLAEITFAGARVEGDLAPLLPAADALLVFHDISLIGEATFSRAPRCRGVVRAGVGYNNIDLVAAGRHGIAVCNVPDYGTEEVADHAMMLFLAVARQLIPTDSAIRAGGRDYRTAQATPRLRGRTLGLIGCGRIGTAMALRAQAFGLDVVFYDPYVAPGLEKALGLRRVDRLDQLMEQSFCVSLHCYLDASNHHMINADTLALMPRGGVLINTARGGLVDLTALVAALDSGHLLGAGIDVVEHEPLTDEHLRVHPRVVLTPHTAFYSQEGFVELRRKAAEEVRRLLLNERPRCLVNRELLTQPRVRI